MKIRISILFLVGLLISATYIKGTHAEIQSHDPQKAIKSNEIKTDLMPFEEKNGYISQYAETYYTYGIALSRALAPNLRKILQPKGPLETSSEFEKRSNYLSLETGPVDINKDYGLVLLDGNLGKSAAMGLSASYNADKEEMEIRSGTFCIDWIHTQSSKTNLGKDFGIQCSFGALTNIIISSKQVDFLKYLIGWKKESLLWWDEKLKISRKKVSELPLLADSKDKFQIGMMIVGRINKNLLITNFKEETEERNINNLIIYPRIPFSINRVIYYNGKNGEIIASHSVR